MTTYSKKPIEFFSQKRLKNYQMIAALANHTSFIEELCKLDFIEGNECAYPHLFYDFWGVFDLEDGDTERQDQGYIKVITILFNFEVGAYVLRHLYLDLPDITSPSISDVIKYYKSNLGNIIKWEVERDLALRASIRLKIEAKNASKTYAPCTIYVALDTTCGYYKVGRTKNVASREQVLMAQKPTIKIVAQFDGLASDEGKVHDKLKKAGCHVRGEWFDLSLGESMAIIENHFKIN